MRSGFLRLYGDIVDELNVAVRCREAEGVSRKEIAKKAGVDPAVLSRVLSGRAGSNARTIAAILNGTDHRFKIKAVACESLATYVWECKAVEHSPEVKVLEFRSIDGCWMMESQSVAESSSSWEFAPFETIKSAAKVAVKVFD